MTDYRDRQVRGVLIPCDERIAIGEPETKSIRDWLKAAEIDWMTLIHSASIALNLSLLVDDDGASRRLPWNSRAHFLSGYPITAPILGNAIVVSLDYISDGYETVDIKSEAEAYVMDKDKRAEEHRAWLVNSAHQRYFATYHRQFPQPPAIQ